MQRTVRRETSSHTRSPGFPDAQTSSRATYASGRRHVEGGEETKEITWAEKVTEQAQPPGNLARKRKAVVGPSGGFFLSLQLRFLEKRVFFIIK